MTIRLQPLVRARLGRLPDAGTAWVDGLPALLADLESAWDVRIERRSLPGGSSSLVAAATTASGEPRAVKIAIAGEDLAQEARVLAAAEGRGYALLHAYDRERQAILMERLGTSLEQSPRPVEDAVDLLVTTLRRGWRTPLDVAPAPPPGGDRASVRLEALLRPDTGAAPSEATPAILARAAEYARRRAAAYDPDACVIAHGDPHPANLLRVRAPRPGAGSGWVLVDPEGFRAEPASDVGVALRDWSSSLQDAAAVERLRAWCDLAAAAAGLDAQAVWEWAYLERVATGLYLTSFGARDLARPFLRSAEALLR